MQTLLVGIACFLFAAPVLCQLGSVLPPGCPNTSCFPLEPTCDINSVGGALAIYAGKVVEPAPLNVSLFSFVENANRTGFIFTPLDTGNQSCEIIEDNLFPDFHRGYIYILGKKVGICTGITNELPLIRLNYGFPYQYPPTFQLYESVLDPNASGAVFGKIGRAHV